MRRVVGASRFLFIAAVLALLALAVVLIIYGTVETGLAVIDLFAEPDFQGGGTKELILEVIEIVDLFLLGVVVFILGTGLYTLFVDSEGMPESMRLRSLGHMKGILASTVIVVIGVAFLGVVFREGDGEGVLWVGLGSGAVIAALTYYIRNADRH